MGSSTSRAIRRRRPATCTGLRPRCAFQTLDSLPLRSTEDQYFSLRGGAERQGHESELDEPTAVGAASDPTKEGRAGSPPLLAVFVTFGTVNAYVAGMARVYYAAARDGVFPT